MKKINLIRRLEKGQIIPLVMFMLFVIIGFVALILDGGSIMANRRTAQAAADAGAMAGAQRACQGYPDAKSVAESYAIANNATAATANVSGTEVTVVASVENTSFFAKIFGEDTLEANADATAGCYGVKGTAPLPIAWYCRSKAIGGGPYDPSYGCQMQTISWNLLGPMADPNWQPSSERTNSILIGDYDGNTKSYHMSGTNVVDNSGIPPKQLYIIMDDYKVCMEDDLVNGDLPCDLDGDGKLDIMTGGNRGWLYLTSNSTSLLKWIGDPPPPLTVQSHTWLSGDAGNMTSLYNKMMDSNYAGRVVLVPVYNYICDGDPRTDSSCVAGAHASPWPALPAGGDNFDEIRNKKNNYHVATFQPFYITCITTSGDCPGAQMAEDIINDPKFRFKNVIEGFFLTDVDVSADPSVGCDLNLGNCVISLSD